jgi:hypothetical protein
VSCAGVHPWHRWWQSKFFICCVVCNEREFEGHAIVFHVDHDPDRQDENMPPELRSDRPWRLAVRATTSFRSPFYTVSYFEHEAEAHEARDVVEAAVCGGMKQWEILDLINSGREGF